MEAPLRGHPSPVIEWFYNDQPIESSDAIVISQDDEFTTAVIPKVQPEDSGTFTCTVSSLKGSTTKKFLLNVECKYGKSDPKNLQGTVIGSFNSL